MFAAASIAEVTLQSNHMLGHFDSLFDAAKTYYVRYPWIGFGLAMRHAHAAADCDIKAAELAVFLYRNKAQVLRKDVHVIGGRNRYRYLEFAWQICRPVNGLDIRRTLDFFSVKPDFVIGARLRRQKLADCDRSVVIFTMNR